MVGINPSIKQARREVSNSPLFLLLCHLPCWPPEVPEVVVVLGVAVAGLVPLYREVFSLIVAVSTVFCRLKLDGWTLLLILGAADGGPPDNSFKQHYLERVKVFRFGKVKWDAVQDDKDTVQVKYRCSG